VSTSPDSTDSAFDAALAGAAMAEAESRSRTVAQEAPAPANGGTTPEADAAAETVPQPVEAGRADEPLAIHHVGIAVSSIDDAMRFYGEKLGLDIADRLELPERSLRVAFVRAGNTLLELLEPTNTESTVARFIERRGQGLHHLCFGTPDIGEHLRDLKDKGVELIDEAARPGAHGDVAFIAPAAAFGVLVELLQELPPEKLAAREDLRPY
jgi:methylmalonyl-CoA/ethylmalonyl-CoA epimerase